MLRNKKILLCVTGGIAVYKACDLTSKLVQQHADVKVMMSHHATKFVSPLTFQALSRNHVFIDTFDEKDPSKIAHIDLADWADIIIIAPATANIIGKLANGISDDMITTTLLVSRAKKYVAPAMNVHMYKNKAVQTNMSLLVERDYHFIEPGDGYLACGYVGKGRLEEPITMIETIKQHLKDQQLLKGKRVLISAGPTREKIDPVRFFTNQSSGKMGFALAETAANLGADVTLVAGPVSIQLNHPNITRINVTSAEEMYDKMHEHYALHEIVIKSAAVADYRPKIVYDEKLKKSDEETDLHIEMERTKDILLSLGEKKEHQFLVGFAAETTNPLENGKVKLKKKHLDAIIINDIKEKGAGFEGDTNIVTYVNKKDKVERLGLATKHEIARSVLLFIHRDMEGEMME